MIGKAASPKKGGASLWEQMSERKREHAHLFDQVAYLEKQIKALGHVPEPPPETAEHSAATASSGGRSPTLLKSVSAKVMKAANGNLSQLFARLDDDGSGSLSHKELRIGLRRECGALSDEELDAITNYLDSDGDGEV